MPDTNRSWRGTWKCAHAPAVCQIEWSLHGNRDKYSEAVCWWRRRFCRFHQKEPELRQRKTEDWRTCRGPSDWDRVQPGTEGTFTLDIASPLHLKCRPTGRELCILPGDRPAREEETVEGKLAAGFVPTCERDWWKDKRERDGEVEWWNLAKRRVPTVVKQA